MKSLIVLAGVFAFSLSGTATAEFFHDALLSDVKLSKSRGGVAPSDTLGGFGLSDVQHGENGNYGIGNSGGNVVGVNNGSGSGSNGTSGNFSTGISNVLVNSASSNGQ